MFGSIGVSQANLEAAVILPRTLGVAQSALQRTIAGHPADVGLGSWCARATRCESKLDNRSFSDQTAPAAQAAQNF
jgi:hypothetical protein